MYFYVYNCVIFKILNSLWRIVAPHHDLKLETMRKVSALLVIIGILWGGAAIAADEKQKITAVGTATIHNNIIDIARDKAIDNALRTAVERVAGVMVSSSTEVENFQVKMDTILSESKGFVEQYKILSEKQNGDNYEVAIEAVIGTGKLEDRMKAIDLIVARKSKPRLMIIFSEQAQKDAIAETAMSKFFLSKGFKLVDSSVIRKGSSDLNLSSSTGNEKALTNLAHMTGAEIAIYGSIEAASNSVVLAGIEMNTNKVSISVKVINGDTGDLITTDSESRSAPGAKGDVKGIAEDAAAKLAAKILSGTIERWSTELTNTLTVKLIVSGFGDYQSLLSFTEMLPLVVKGFRTSYQRAYVQGNVDIDIEFKGNIQGLADDLSVMTMKGNKIKLLEITPNKIVGALIPL